MTRFAENKILRISVNHKFQQSTVPTGFETVVVETVEQLAELVRSSDHATGVFRNGYRSTANFLSTDWLYGDVDEGMTIEQFETHPTFAETEYVIVTSRNHRRPKAMSHRQTFIDGLGLTIVERYVEEVVCDRFHVLFPIETQEDPIVVCSMLRYLQSECSAFDSNAKDASRFLYASPEALVLYHPGKRFEAPSWRPGDELGIKKQLPLVNDAERVTQRTFGLPLLRTASRDEALLAKLMECANAGDFDEMSTWIKLGVALFEDGYTEEDWRLLSWPGVTQMDTLQHWVDFGSHNNRTTGASLFWFVRRRHPNFGKKGADNVPA